MRLNYWVLGAYFAIGLDLTISSCFSESQLFGSLMRALGCLLLGIVVVTIFKVIDWHFSEIEKAQKKDLTSST